MNITILGCGAYGQALLTMFRENKSNIIVWDKYDSFSNDLKNGNKEVVFTTDLREAVINSNLIVFAIPVAFLDSTVRELSKYYSDQSILIASKGISVDDCLFSHEIVCKYIKPSDIGVISGGTFAIDMQNKKLSGLTLATKSLKLKNIVNDYLVNKYLKVQVTDDLIGVEVCGAIKNVMAVGFGMLDGAEYPESTRFLFLTEAIYEINKLILALGGNNKTILSYAGIDDISMTCTSYKSRNYSFGKMIGQKKSQDEINEYKSSNTIEGLGTALAIFNLAKNKKIDLLLCTIIYNIIYKNEDINTLINYLEKKESNF